MSKTPEPNADEMTEMTAEAYELLGVLADRSIDHQALALSISLLHEDHAKRCWQTHQFPEECPVFKAWVALSGL